MTLSDLPLNLSLDSLVLAQVGHALTGHLAGARVQKVQSVGDRAFLLHLRQGGNTVRLGISLDGRGALVALREEVPSLPAPPPFVSLLRKHLTGARLVTAATDPPGERMLVLGFAREGEVLGPEAPRLVVEAMGRDSNVLLLGSDGHILDALRRSGPGENPYRTVLPGRPYVPPPPSPLPSVAALTAEDFPALAARWAGDVPAEQALRRSLSGLSPLTIRELLCRSGVQTGLALSDPEALRPHLLRLAEAYRTPLPSLYLWQEGNRLVLSPLPPCGGSANSQALPVLEALGEAVRRAEEGSRFGRLREETGKVLRRERERLLRKERKQEEEQAAAREDEQLRHLGELLISFLYQIRPGNTSVEVPDYTREDSPRVTIPLDPRLTPSQNAQALFARYQKARRRLERLSAYLEETRREREYLDALLGQWEEAEGVWELEQLAEEMRSQGYLPPERVRRPLPPPPPPLRYRVGPHLVRVGRNHRENEELWREARPGDLWFHVQNIPGSHVYLVPQDREPVTEEHLRTAALVAAYHSRARGGSHVPVDMTTRQKVWRPKGARPGQVLYRDARTLTLTPDASRLPLRFSPEEREPEPGGDRGPEGPTFG